MHTPAPQKALDALLSRFGSHAGAVPLPAALGLRDALDGVPLQEWA